LTWEKMGNICATALYPEDNTGPVTILGNITATIKEKGRGRWPGRHVLYKAMQFKRGGNFVGGLVGKTRARKSWV